MSTHKKDPAPRKPSKTQPDELIVNMERRMRQLELKLDDANNTNYELRNQLASSNVEHHIVPAHRAHSPAVSPVPEKKPHVADDQEQQDNHARSQGGLFLIQHELFLFGGKRLFRRQLRADYHPEQRYDTQGCADGLAQGQLHEIQAFLPLDLQPHMHADWFASAFTNGFNHQRSQAVLRIRTVCAATIFGKYAPDMVDDEHKQKLKWLIGYKPDDANGPHYSVFDVPILHKTVAEGFRKDEVFLGQSVIMGYMAYTRAPSGLKAYFLGRPIDPNPKQTLEELHGIDRITSGAIAGSSVMTLFALSTDHTFYPRGTSTKIDYADRFNQYKSYLDDGLKTRKASVINIFRVWNETIFPETAKPHVPRVLTLDCERQEKLQVRAALEADEEVPAAIVQVDGGTIDPARDVQAAMTRNHSAAVEEPGSGSGDEDEDTGPKLHFVRRDDDDEEDLYSTTGAPASGALAASMDIDDANSQPFLEHAAAARRGTARANACTRVVPPSPPSEPGPSTTKGPTRGGAAVRRGTRRNRNALLRSNASSCRGHLLQVPRVGKSSSRDQPPVEPLVGFKS